MNEFCPFMSKGKDEKVECSNSCKLFIQKGSLYAPESKASDTCTFKVLLNEVYGIQKNMNK